MFALLSPRLWIAAAVLALLAGTHFAAYRSGRAAVTANWNAERLVQQTARADRERENRTIEQKRIKGANDAMVKFETLRGADRAAAAGARTELQRLLDATSSPVGPAPSDPATAACVDDLARTREVFRRSTTALQQLAVTADDGETRLTALQDWVRSACTAP